jgi:hypothetical protein
VMYPRHATRRIAAVTVRRVFRLTEPSAS